MPEQLSIQTWAVIGQWLIYGGSISAAVLGISKFIQWLRSKTTVAKLEEQVKQHETYLDNDNQRLKALETRLTESEEDRNDIHEVLRLLLSANQELLKSNLEGGNNRDGMAQADKKIQEYLNKQV